MFKTKEERDAYVLGMQAGKIKAIEERMGKPLGSIPFEELKVKDVLAYSRETHSELNSDYTEPVAGVDPDTLIWPSDPNHNIAVFWIKGGSEGYYVHVEMIFGTKHIPLIYVKCWDVSSAEKIVRDLSRFIWGEWRN